MAIGVEISHYHTRRKDIPQTAIFHPFAIMKMGLQILEFPLRIINIVFQPLPGI